MADRRRLKGWACAPAAIALAAAFAWSAYTSIGAADEPPAPSTDSPAPQDSPKPPQDPVTPPADQPPPATPAPEQPAPPPPVEPPPPAKEAPHPPKNLEPLPKDDAVTVLGKKVRGPAGEDMGRVVDLLLDRDAQPRAVVIDFGGFLGVGSRKIAIDWRLVRFVPDDRDAPLMLSLGKAEVQAAPEYKDTAQPPVMVGQPPPDPDAAR
jgi:hypothetical protein